VDGSHLRHMKEGGNWRRYCCHPKHGVLEVMCMGCGIPRYSELAGRDRIGPNQLWTLSVHMTWRFGSRGAQNTNDRRRYAHFRFFTIMTREAVGFG
jgi:hypothetical protein